MTLLTLMVCEWPVTKVDITEISCHACLPYHHLLSLSLRPPCQAPRTLYMPPGPPASHPHPFPIAHRPIVLGFTGRLGGSWLAALSSCSKSGEHDVHRKTT